MGSQSLMPFQLDEDNPPIFDITKKNNISKLVFDENYFIQIENSQKLNKSTYHEAPISYKTLEGEQEVFSTGASWNTPEFNMRGKLIATNYRIIFIPLNSKNLKIYRIPTQYFRIPLGFIYKCFE